MAQVLISGTMLTWSIQHGIAIGYYLTFFLGGFVTYVGRKCRAGFRPLVLPPPRAPPTWAKRLYDFLGTSVCILLLNFLAAPFMLLNFADSMEAWSRLGWYGCWIVGSGIIFFNAGGSKYLQGLQKQTDLVDARERQTPSPDVVAPVEPTVEELKMRMN